MTRPRRYLPGQVKAVTRRTVDGKYFLTPTAKARHIQEYAFGLALSRHETVRVSAFCAMSNHTHCVLRDDRPSDTTEHSQISDLFQQFHSLSARALNHLLGRGGALWEQGSFHDVDVFERLTLEQQLLYLWLNPVRAGLVERPEDWPGLMFGPEDLGKTFTVTRPDTGFFTGALAQEARAARAEREARAVRTQAGLDGRYERPSAEVLSDEEDEARERLRNRRRAERDRSRGRSERRQRRLARDRARRRTKRRSQPRAAKPAHRPPKGSELPLEVTYTIHRPPGYEHLSDDELRAYFRALLDQALAEVHAERRAAKRGYRGPDRVRKQDPHARPPGSTRPTHARAPKVACKNRHRRVVEVAQLEEFLHQNHATRERWGQGNHQARFPHGSYGLPRHHAAPVVRPPPQPS
ncbi:MAG: transposase [Planctomycetota bacterium]